MLGQIIDVLAGLGGWGVAAGLVFSVAFYLFGDLYRQDGRGWWIAQLRHNSFARRYRALTGAALDAVDGFFAARARPTQPRTGFWSAFDDAAASLTMRLAWFVSGASTLLVMVLAGQGSRLAGIAIMDDAVTARDRWVFALVLALLVAAAFFVRRIEGAWRRLAARMGAFIALLLVLAVVSIKALSAPDAFMFSVYAPILGFVALSFRRVEALFLTGPVLLYHNLLPVLLLVFWFRERAARRFGRTLVFCAFALLTITLFVGMTAVITVQHDAIEVAIDGIARIYELPPIDHRRVMFLLDALLLFLVVLPIAMGLSWFVSLSLTRWFLRAGLERGIVLHAALDLAASLALLLVQSLVLVWLVRAFGLVFGGGARMAERLFADMAQSPPHYWWLVVPVMLSLLPTLTHLAIAAFSLFSVLLRPLGPALAASLAGGDAARGRLAGLTLALLATVSVCLPAYILLRVALVLPAILLFFVTLAFFR